MWILTTYRRPDRCQQALQSIMDARVGPKGIVVIDEPAAGYPVLSVPEGWSVVEMIENGGFIEAHRAVLKAFPDEPWYGFITDDMVVETEFFENRLVERLSKNTLIVSANDGWRAPERIQCAVYDGPFYKWLLQPENFPAVRHCFYDDVLEAIGRKFGIWETRMDVMVRHNHCFNGKAPEDENYRKSYSFFKQDEKAYVEWLATVAPKVYAQIATSLEKMRSPEGYRRVPTLGKAENETD